MGFNVQKNRKSISEINVTPLVDVMLVLLVIFMVTAPMMYSGIQMKLPKTKKVNSIHLKERQVILSMNRAGDIFIDKEKIEKKRLVKHVNELMALSSDKTIYIRAHQKTFYENVAKVMSVLKTNGHEQIALVTEIER